MPPITDIEDGRSHEERIGFFKAVYDRAGGDQDQIPWASDAAKPEVINWLNANPVPHGARALDVACGLGENAEALAAAGYQTLAFDVSDTAITWAKERYPDSMVDYRQADMFHLPDAWGQFELVHECYTLQSLPEDLRPAAFAAIAGMVKPEGTLLVYARVRPDGTKWDQAPWPVMVSEFKAFEKAGLSLVQEDHFEAPGSRGLIPHAFLVYRK